MERKLILITYSSQKGCGYLGMVARLLLWHVMNQLYISKLRRFYMKQSFMFNTTHTLPRFCL